MIGTFDLVVVSEIRKMMKQLHEGSNVNAWASFNERLKDEYFDKDTKRMNKRDFLIT